jgi:hypothetical protein
MLLRRSVLVYLLVMSAAAAAYTQTPATPPSGTIPTVEVDPIRCWWRTSTGAVRVGELFDLTLTCAVLDNEDVQIVADETHLGAAVIALAPFEVVRGTPPSRLRSGQRQFFQYQYTLRIINPDAIGKDVRVPDVVIHYKVNSRVAANTALEGRDLTYVLPPQSVRVTSMVPADATDIRDATGASFAAVDALSLRAGTLEIVAVMCAVLGALLVVVALARLARRARKRTPADERLLTTRAVAAAAMRELAAVQRERDRDGWTDQLAGRALAATRVAAACAIGRPVNQRPADTTAPEEGRILAAAWRGKSRSLSTPVTAGDVQRAAARDPDRQPILGNLADALTTFSERQYGRATALDQTALDAALASANAAAGRVKAEHSWLKTLLRQFSRGRTAVESRA